MKSSVLIPVLLQEAAQRRMMGTNGEVCPQEEADVVFGRAGCNAKSRAGAER